MNSNENRVSNVTSLCTARVLVMTHFHVPSRNEWTWVRDLCFIWTNPDRRSQNSIWKYHRHFSKISLGCLIWCENAAYKEMAADPCSAFGRQAADKHLHILFFWKQNCVKGSAIVVHMLVVTPPKSSHDKQICVDRYTNKFTRHVYRRSRHRVSV